MRGRWCSLPSVGGNGRAVTPYGITQRVPGEGGVQTLAVLEFSGWLGGVSYATATVSGWLSPSSGHVQLAQKFPQKL